MSPFVLKPRRPYEPGAAREFENNTSRARGHVMFKIGQGVQVVDATGEGVRLRPLADALSDALSGSGLRAAFVEADPAFGRWGRPQLSSKGYSAATSASRTRPNSLRTRSSSV